MKKIVVILIIFIIFGVVFIAINLNKKDNSYKNNFYSNNLNKIDEKDFRIDKISFNMSMKEVEKILGTPLEVSEFVDSEENENSYKRYDYENLIIQFDYDKETVNYIASSKKDYKNTRGISVGDTLTDVLKAYYADKNIEVYENEYGKYEILYGIEDAIKYIDDLNSQNKTFGYIYKHEEQVDSIIFSTNGQIIEFYFTDNIVNMIIVAKSYKPW